MNIHQGFFFPFLIILGGLLLPSCALDKIATRALADTLSAPGSNTVFTGDDDPQLVGDSLPFTIKMYESILASQPDHRPLRTTVGSLYVMYANAFVATPAQFLPEENFEEKDRAKIRAKNLYLRAGNILKLGLSQVNPQFEASFSGYEGALSFERLLDTYKKEDVSTLYWYAAAWLSAASLDVLDGTLSLRIPQVKAMVDRAFALDPDWQGGALHSFLMIYYSSMPEMLGGSAQKALFHYDALLRLGKGASADAWMARAETWALPRQDKTGFVDFMNKILSLDPQSNKDQTLVTVLAQNKAKYYLKNLELLFWSDVILEGNE